jgi:hypothetical protein
LPHSPVTTRARYRHTDSRVEGVAAAVRDRCETEVAAGGEIAATPRSGLRSTARARQEALRWLQRFIDERLPPLTEVALAASALAELRHGNRNAGVETLKRLLRSG